MRHQRTHFMRVFSCAVPQHVVSRGLERRVGRRAALPPRGCNYGLRKCAFARERGGKGGIGGNGTSSYGREIETYIDIVTV